MAETEAIEQADELPPEKTGRDWGKYIRRRLAALLLGVVLLIGGAALLIDSPIGHRLITNSLASYAPASGLRIKIGRIDGSILGEATLHDVVFSDSKGVFLTVPEAELDWRPLEWFTSGLDVRKLIGRRGQLKRLPDLKPGDPDAPILPDFPIRIDRFELDRLHVDKSIAGTARIVNLLASIDIADGRAKVKLDSQLGGQDRLALDLDASEAKNVLQLDFQYNAPAGGFLAGLVGAEDDVTARIRGDGKWSAWTGGLLVTKGGEPFTTMRLTKKGERYGALGQVYPGDLLTGIPARAVGKTLSVKFETLFDSSVFDMESILVGQGMAVRARGIVDLADNRLSRFAVASRVSDPDLLGLRAEGLIAVLGLDGPFDDLAAAYRIRSDRVVSGTTRLAGIAASGTAQWDGTALVIPVQATARRIETGVPLIDARLAKPVLGGTITYRGDRLTSQDLSFNATGLNARMALDGNVATGRYALTGPVAAQGLMLEGIGRTNARADVDLVIGGRAGWTLSAKTSGKVTRVTNSTIENIAGPAIGFTANVTASGNAPVLVRSARLTSRSLRMQVSGSRASNGTVKIAGRGEQADYGAFTVDSTIDGAGPHAVLVFASPLPAAGLKDVRVALDPEGDGFRIATEGDSTLGPFDGEMFFSSPSEGPTRLDITRLTVSDTDVSGTLALGEGGATGDLALIGGGVEGTIALSPAAEGQGIAADLAFRDARFDGPTPITLRTARLTANGTLGQGGTITGKLRAQGISRGNLFIGRLAAEGQLKDGAGSFTAALAGRRGQRFNLRVIGDIAPERIAVAARGRFGTDRISMPRRAVLLKQDGDWVLERSQLNFAGGSVLGEGRIGAQTQITVKVLKMPLRLADLANADLALGGTVSGVVEYNDTPGSLATGRVRLKFDDLTRSGLVLTSRPVDIALVADLGPADLQARAVFSDNARQNGRLQARIADLPEHGTLVERLRAGNLFAQMRYSGPADALWRLAAIESFDLTGPVEVAGDIRGTLDNPVVRGSLKSDNLRLQSALTGTDISGLSARGTFDGSVLRIGRFSGTAANGGSVSGTGSIDLSNVFETGVGMDLRIAARDARLLDRSDMAATVTGPLRIVAKDNVGTIAGRLDVVSGRWQLSNAEAAAALPNITTREINVPPDRQQRASKARPWRYLIDVQANNRFSVKGMGLDSEWGVDVRLRGTTDEPRLLGEANLVRGDYTFAGKRFELTRGRIRFAGASPPAPRLDVVAEADINDINARISITGTALAPQIAFSSIPALPEEEVLSRLLFGDSISNISAPEALQLGAALASMRGDGGGGLDPINKLRSAIGLDRLRVVGADVALGRGTSVAVGEYLGRNLYVELVTDGQGYSATELEYRVTAWLSLLATVSSLGNNGIEAEISKDY